jgi:DNA-binding transcriptional regulator of glucitol operon
MAPRTIAQRAHEEDLALWASSASIEEYEERRRARDEQRRSEREAFMRGQPVFHRFLSLPAELRLMIWKMALEEPTRVILFILTRTMPSRQSGGWCGTTFPISWEHVATATLPPLMLVNCESHRVASRHYQRAFRGLHARGGVLAAYPTVLTVKGDAFTPMQTDGLRFVRDFVLEYETYSQTSTGIDDKFRPAVLQAPDLQTFTVLTRRQDPAAAPSILSRLRRLFRELTEAHPHLNVPTIELCFGNGVEDAPEWICCFRGSPLMLLET